MRGLGLGLGRLGRAVSENAQVPDRRMGLQALLQQAILIWMIDQRLSAHNLERNGSNRQSPVWFSGAPGP